MKKINVIFIIYALLMIIISLYCLFDYKSKFLNIEADREYFNNVCSIDNMKSTDICIDFFQNGVKEPTVTAQYLFYYITDISLIGYLNIFGALVLCAMILYDNSKLLSSGVSKLFLIREGYKKLFKRLFLNCIKYSLLYVALFLIIYVLCMFFSNFNFDISNYTNISFFDMRLFKYGNISFIIVWFLNALIMSFIYSLCSLISMRVVKNYFGSLILSFLIFVSLDIISHVIIGALFMYNLFGFQNYDIFNLINAYNLKNIDSYLLYFLIRFGIIFILLVIIFIIYKNKEKFVKYIERARRKL